MVEQTMFPRCCTGILVSNFGGYAADVTRERDSDVTRAALQKAIATGKVSGDAFVCVTSNNRQRKLNKILRELGFVSTPWMGKRKHVDTKVRIWWYRINGPELC